MLELLTWVIMVCASVIFSINFKLYFNKLAAVSTWYFLHLLCWMDSVQRSTVICLNFTYSFSLKPIIKQQQLQMLPIKLCYLLGPCYFSMSKYSPMLLLPIGIKYLLYCSQSPGGDARLLCNQSMKLIDLWKQQTEKCVIWKQKSAQFSKVKLVFRQLQQIYSTKKQNLLQPVLSGKPPADPSFLIWAS